MNQKLHTVVLACRQAVPDPALFLGPLTAAGFQARLILEPCSSKVETFQLLRILAGEADILWVVGCPEAVCQLVEGSARMSKRVAHTQDYLREIGLEAERLGVSLIPAGNREDVEAAVSEIQKRALALGVNPARAGAPVAKEQP